MNNFGISKEQIDLILDKHKIKSEEMICVDNIRLAINEIVETNNEVIQHYLKNDFIDVIENKLSMKYRSRR